MNKSKDKERVAWMHAAIELNAKREGWSLFECDDGRLRIQRLDFPYDSTGRPIDPLFDSDESAVQFVKDLADTGSSFHQVTLRLHGMKVSKSGE
jgi:hypothetical protein